MKLINIQMETLWWKYKAEGIAKNLSLQAFCSIHGARARAILRSFIETCKLQGIGIVNYMTDYFNAVYTGRTDYENTLPATIGIAR